MLEARLRGLKMPQPTLLIISIFFIKNVSWIYPWIEDDLERVQGVSADPIDQLSACLSSLWLLDLDCKPAKDT